MTDEDREKLQEAEILLLFEGYSPDTERAAELIHEVLMNEECVCDG